MTPIRFSKWQKWVSPDFENLLKTLFGVERGGVNFSSIPNEPKLKGKSFNFLAGTISATIIDNQSILC